MKPSIVRLEKKFDPEAILNSLPPEIHSPEFEEKGQLAITHSRESDSWYDGVGSLYDYEQSRFTRQTSDYVLLNSYFKGTYLENVVAEVGALAREEGVRLGRIRIMQLKPKTCYSLHRDLEEFRYHIPLLTNEKNFFVSGNQVEFMPERGCLYRFFTQDYHTAVNASFEKRVHLVFDTFMDNHGRD